MILVFCAFGNPPAKQVFLLGLEHAMLLGGRHDILIIGGEDAFDEFAFVRFARHNGLLRKRILADIKTQLAFALFLVCSMAFETGV